jgi:hypothetical protein
MAYLRSVVPACTAALQPSGGTNTANSSLSIVSRCNDSRIFAYCPRSVSFFAFLRGRYGNSRLFGQVFGKLILLFQELHDARQVFPILVSDDHILMWRKHGGIDEVVEVLDVIHLVRHDYRFALQNVPVPSKFSMSSRMPWSADSLQSAGVGIAFEMRKILETAVLVHSDDRVFVSPIDLF